MVLRWRVVDFPPGEVELARDDEGEELLSSPQGPWLEDCWGRHFPVPGRQEHQQVHHLLLVDEDVSLCHLTHSGKCVLHNSHHRFVRLRRDDLGEN